MKERKRVKNIADFNIISRDFSDVEDNAEAFQIIHILAAYAGNNAAAEAKAAGLPRVYIRNYKDLVKVSAAGDEIAISPKVQRLFYVKYNPSIVLHAVRK